MPKCETCDRRAVKTYKLNINFEIGDRIENLIRYGALCAECYEDLYARVDEFLADMIECGITQEQSEELSKLENGSKVL